MSEWLVNCSDKLRKQLLLQNRSVFMESEEDFFSGFVSLYLEDLQEGGFPEIFTKMKKLKVLVISKSNIGTELKSSQFPENLTHLSIGQCGIKRFDITKKGLSDLISLNLQSNLLASIPSKLDTLELLYEIKLSNNNLSGKINLPEMKAAKCSWDLTSNGISSVYYISNKLKSIDILVDNGVSLSRRA